MKSALLLAALAVWLHGCTSGDCRSGKKDCIVAAPCPELTPSACEGGFVRLSTIGPGDPRPGGLDALSSVGDLRIENDQIVAIIDALDHQHYVSPAGGAILDLASQGGDDDSINHIFQATGLLPDEAAHYTSMEMIQENDFVAIVVRGTLDGHPDQKIATRYEVRPCEPGIRVRTEYVNLDDDDAIVTVADGWYWSGRSALPFTPLPGIGFEHADFGLTDIQDVYFEIPWMAASGHSKPSAAYSIVACSQPFLEGFQSATVSAVGTKRRIIPPRGSQVLDRFISVVPGRSIGPAVDVALDVRERLFDEPRFQFTGRVLTSSVTNEVKASVAISAQGTPLTQVVPDPDGSFSAFVPVRDQYTVHVSAFGRILRTRKVFDPVPLMELGNLFVDPPGVIEATGTIDGRPHEMQVFLHPADDSTDEGVRRKLLGNFDECAPLLGPPHGGSPACNRFFVDGPTRVEVPPGRYDAYATAGPFNTLHRIPVDVRSGLRTRVQFSLRSLPLLPAEVLMADFHVHGAASFDSSIPDLDRVRAFLAADVDVIVATDHDVVHDYAAARAALDVDDRIKIITGLETTGQILWDLDDDVIPKVVGHYNFWPLVVQPDLPKRGAPNDEVQEPGTLFTLLSDSGHPETGVRQLNHPWADAEFGRDLGFPRALAIDFDEPLPELLSRTPPGARFANDAYHVQEVMNGTKNAGFLSDRAFWFQMLNRGVIRGGTANSDSHSISDNVLGTPRTIVFTDTTTAAFDQATFDASVRAGRMVGTNGPVIELMTDTGALPSTDVVEGASSITIRVSAAPWVPVEEVRIYVNGELVQTLGDLPSPPEPFGDGGLLRTQQTLQLTDLMSGDGWLIVEAGSPHPMSADLNCDGIPDTGDNDGNGVVDWRDVEDREDEPEPCEGPVGPLGSAPRPPRGTRAYHFEAVTPEGYPLAFTNPLILRGIR